MRRTTKTAAEEYHHELRLGIVAGCFSFPIGYLIASLFTAELGWTAMLPELLTAMVLGVGGLILGSIYGGRMDRASEKAASRKRTRPSSTGREHSAW